MDEKEFSPIVSIIVITYNSAKYVLDTLESCKSQDYGVIELIISDDCSTDFTMDLIKYWAFENAQYFTRVKTVRTQQNSGVIANAINGIRHSRGEWVKLIAGDDVLVPNSISEFVDFLSSCNIDKLGAVLAKEYRFYDEDISNFHRGVDNSNHPIFNDSISSINQLKWLLIGKRFLGAALFYNRKALLSAYKDNSNFHMLEDILFVRILSLSGYLVTYWPVETVFYRLHQNSISAKTRDIYPNYIQEELFINKLIYNQSGIRSLGLKLAMEYRRLQYRLVLLLGNKGIFARLLNSLMQGVSPVRVLAKYWQFKG